MKKIDISSRKHPNTFTLVDDLDYEALNRYKWCAAETEGKLYVVRTIRVNGKRKPLRLHVSIMGQVEGREIDHRSGDTLDNQRHNLRHCTHKENGRNRKLGTTNTSGYKGVSWKKRDSKWRACIQLNGKLIHLGSFTCLMKAARAYNTAASKYFGEFARLNEIPEICCLAKENSND
jgi:hypothetical protein